jgi:hypothetical protein
MHKEQHRQQHLKSNNIISKLAVIVLSIVLLTGISLVPALQIGVNGQVQQQQQQQLEGFQTYENPTYGFSIQYPSDWQINYSSFEDLKEGDKVGEIVAIFKSPEGSYFTITVSLNLSPQYLDTNTLTLKNKTAQDFVLEEITNKLPSDSIDWGFTYKVIRNYESTVAGMEAWSLEQIQNSTYPSESSRYFRDTYILKDDRIYNFLESSEPLLVPKTLSITQKMIDSFRFINNTAAEEKGKE